MERYLDRTAIYVSPMSALGRITDSNQSSRHIRKVPDSDIATFIRARFNRVSNIKAPDRASDIHTVSFAALTGHALTILRAGLALNIMVLWIVRTGSLCRLPKSNLLTGRSVPVLDYWITTKLGRAR